VPVDTSYLIEENKNMTKKPKGRDWNKAQPHHATTGEITTRKFAEKNPNKVEWVKVKAPKKKR
jgi:hypothetical protein